VASAEPAAPEEWHEKKERRHERQKRDRDRRQGRESRRDSDRRQSGDGRHTHEDRRDGDRRPPRESQPRPELRFAGPSRKGGVDPDSPFASLGALKDALEKQMREKSSS
jgi:ATP-dependent RNA helicase SUPV3L1/SUV3